MCSVARGSTRRRQAAERRDVVLELLLGLFRHGADRLVERGRDFLGRARVDLVVDVGDVAHVGDVLGAVEMAQQPEQHVEHDHRPRIADMGEVVDRRPAHIHAHARGIDRGEQPLLAGQRIVELQFHRRVARTPKSTRPRPAGRASLISIRRKDGRSQRVSLANNLPANAADWLRPFMGRTMGTAGLPSRGGWPGLRRSTARAVNGALTPCDVFFALSRCRADLGRKPRALPCDPSSPA